MGTAREETFDNFNSNRALSNTSEFGGCAGRRNFVEYLIRSLGVIISYIQEKRRTGKMESVQRHLSRWFADAAAVIMLDDS